jgi:hypothetical protein
MRFLGDVVSAEYFFNGSFNDFDPRRFDEARVVIVFAFLHFF